MKKRLKRPASILLALCLLAALLPQRALAAEIPVPDGGDLAQAVENAAAGSTLVLQGSCVVGTENGGDAPWVIDKALTIRGGSITVWRGGIVLGDNVTFQNTEINFSSFMRNAIVANGYTLTLDSVTCPTGRSVNLFCGGLLDSNNENFGSSLPAPDPAQDGTVIVRGNTSLQGDGKSGTGNIYAGNLCMGRDNDGPANVYDGNPSIQVGGLTGTGSGAIGTIYACGAQQRNGDGGVGKITLPDPDSYTVNGAVSVILGRSGTPAQGQASVEGAGAEDGTYVSFRDASGKGTVPRQLKSITGLGVESGSLSLSAGTGLLPDASVSVLTGAELNLSALTVPAETAVQSFTGGGSLILGQNQTLSISDVTSGITKVGIGGLNSATSKPAVEGHVYIRAPQSSDGQFQLAPHSTQPNMKLVKAETGAWTAVQEAGETPDERVIVKSLQFTEPSQRVVDSGVSETNFPLTVAYGAASASPSYLSSVPMTVRVNGKEAIPKSMDNFPFYVTGESSGVALMFMDENGVEDLTIVGWNGTNIWSDGYDPEIIPDGRYEIELTVPGTHTEAGASISVSAVLTVGTPDPSQPISIDVPRAETGLRWTGNTLTGVKQGTGYTLTGHTSADVGEHTATAALQSGYRWKDGTEEDKEIIWRIDRALGPAAPGGLVGRAPSTQGGADGSIAGVTPDMEYADRADFDGAGDCTGTEITGLTSGTYYVRVKETATHEPGETATVVVPAWGAPTLTGVSVSSTGHKTVYTKGEALDVTGLTLAARYSDGSTQTVPVTADMVSGYDPNKTGTQTLTVRYGGLSAVYTVEVKAGETPPVEPEKTYHVRVDNSHAAESGAGVYRAGEQVTVRAGSWSGHRFGSWEVHGTVLSGLTSPELQFTMPANDVSFLAIWRASSSGGGGGGGSSSGTTASQRTASSIQSAKDGGTVTMTLSSGSASVGREVWRALAGRDVTLEVKSGPVRWQIHGSALNPESLPSSVNLGAAVKTNAIPSNMLETLPRSQGQTVIQLSLAHNGPFGFGLNMAVDAGKENAGRQASLYYYNSTAGVMEFQSSAQVDKDGLAGFPMTHASAYAVVLDAAVHEPAPVWPSPFRDVVPGDWYYDAVAYVHQNGLMNGSGGAFSVSAPATRGQLAAILHRMAGQPAPAAAAGFQDVAASAYYRDAVAWAAEQGIVSGYAGGRFAPDRPVTREQLAAFLFRYANAQGMAAAADTGALKDFTDRGAVSAYAVEPLSWAVEQGLVNGYADGRLNPQGQATRAQIAAILTRFHRASEEWKQQ